MLIVLIKAPSLKEIDIYDHLYKNLYTCISSLYLHACTCRFNLFFLFFVKQNYAVSKGLKLKPSPSGKENPKTKEMKKEKVIISPQNPCFEIYCCVTEIHVQMNFLKKTFLSNYLHDM